MKNYPAALLRLIGAILSPTYPKNGIGREHLDPDFRCIAHRGAPAKLPENTIPSCELALAQGADGLEIDLCMTSDGVIVLWHDWDPVGEVARLRWLELEPETAYRPSHPEEDDLLVPVGDLSLDTFRKVYGYCDKETDERSPIIIPTFEEFIDWASHQPSLKMLSLDIKIPASRSSMMDRFISELNRIIAPYHDRFEFVLETTEKGILDHLVRGETGCRISFDTEAPPGLVLFPEAFSSADQAILYNLDASLVLRPRMVTVAPWTTYRRIMSHEVRTFRRGGNHLKSGRLERIYCATVNDEREMEWLMKLGVHGIQSDRPDRLRKVWEKVSGVKWEKPAEERSAELSAVEPG